MKLPLAFLLIHSFYDWSCCAERDCEPILSTDVRAVANGWLIKATGEVWLYTETKPSPDGQFHRCWYRAGPKLNHTICLYAPPPGV